MGIMLKSLLLCEVFDHYTVTRSHEIVSNFQ